MPSQLFHKIKIWGKLFQSSPLCRVTGLVQKKSWICTVGNFQESTPPHKHNCNPLVLLARGRRHNIENVLPFLCWPLFSLKKRNFNNLSELFNAPLAVLGKGSLNGGREVTAGTQLRKQPHRLLGVDAALRRGPLNRRPPPPGRAGCYRDLRVGMARKHLSK